MINVIVARIMGLLGTLFSKNQSGAFVKEAGAIVTLSASLEGDLTPL